MRTTLALACAVMAFSQNSPEPTAETYLHELSVRPDNSLAAFRLGELFAKQKNYQSAANQFREALNGDQQPAWVVVRSRIHLARIFEGTGQRERAVVEYKAAVRTNNNYEGSLDEAIQFLKETGNSVPETHPEARAAVFMPLPRGVYPVGPDVQPPVPMLDGDSPVLTEEARLAELEGTVWVGTIVGSDGTPRDIQVMHGIGLGLDENAIETVRKWRFRPGIHEGKEVDTFTTIPIDFLRASKLSRWHLVQVGFQPPDGASRPIFRSVSYPSGAGVSHQSMDEGRVVVGIGRHVVTKLSFDVSPEGRPVQFQVESASDERWGPEAIAVVRNWQFAPGMKDGRPVSVRCTLTLLWGRRNLDQQVLRNLARSALIPRI